MPPDHAEPEGSSGRAGFDLPIPNPPPVPSDLPAPRLIGPGAALRRSLVVWGWGQLATGDRRWLAGPPLQVAVVGFLAWAGPALSAGTAAPLVFLAGAAVLAAWAGIAVHAYRRAARRRLMFDLPGSDGGAISLLWLAPVAIAASTAFWILGGRGADPGTVLDRYVEDWQAGRSAAAAAVFARPPDPAALGDTWARQLPLLRNALVRLAAEAGPAAAIDPDRPLRTIRFVDAGPAADGPGRRIDIQVVRTETERSLLLGFLPTTSDRLVTMATLGTAVVEPIEVDPPAGWGPSTTAWRIRTVTIGDESIGG